MPREKTKMKFSFSVREPPEDWEERKNAIFARLLPEFYAVEVSPSRAPEIISVREMIILLDDCRVSPEAVYMYLFLWWFITNSNLPTYANICDAINKSKPNLKKPYGVWKVSRLINELKEAGYLSINAQRRTDSGTFSRQLWILQPIDPV